jgi:hypothetical protein
MYSLFSSLFCTFCTCRFFFIIRFKKKLCCLLSWPSVGQKYVQDPPPMGLGSRPEIRPDFGTYQALSAHRKWLRSAWLPQNLVASIILNLYLLPHTYIFFHMQYMHLKFSPHAIAFLATYFICFSTFTINFLYLRALFASFLALSYFWNFFFRFLHFFLVHSCISRL